MKHHRTLRSVAAALLTSLLLAGGGVLADTAPASAAASSASSPTTGSTTNAVTAARDGLTLTAPGGTIEAGTPVALQLTPDRAASSYEGVITFDAEFVSFGGAFASESSRVLSVEQPGGGLALAVFPRTTGHASAVTIILTPLVDGPLDVGLDATLVIDRAGATLSNGDVDGSAAPDARWDTDRTPVVADAADSDVTVDGKVDAIDVAEGVAAWLEGHRNGNPCGLDPTTGLADVNGDGCFDVSDLDSLRQAVGTQTPADEVDAESRRRNITERPAYVVNSTGDEDDTAPNNGICLTEQGTCTLRAAIQTANARTGADRIHFAIPGTGVKTIQLTSRLPSITDTTGGVTIDGFTQPGATPNTDPVASNAVLRIEVKGLGYEAGGANFTVLSGRNVFRGLAVYDAFYNFQAFDDAADKNRWVGNHIGTNAAGTAFQTAGFSLQAGIWLYDGPDENVIGTPAIADRNVLSGNATAAVKVEQVGSVGNIVQNNILGLTPSATAKLPNNHGFDLQWYSVGTIVGGSGPNEGNLISGNRYVGVDLSHATRDNQIVGNRIGTWANGASANIDSGNGIGIMFKDNAYRNTIRANIISGNDDDGVWNKHNYTDRNFLYDNYIGVGRNGESIPNLSWGIWLAGEGDIIENNWIANNGDGGIRVTDISAIDPVNPQERTRENRISANVFANNGGLGIDIDDVGVNINDPGDADTGPHDKLNYPEVTSVVAGHVDGTVCSLCQVELYVADPGTDLHGEGRQIVASTVADANGVFAIDSATLAGTVPHTLLAINPANDTSEFGPRFNAGGGGNATWIAPTTIEGAYLTKTVQGKTVHYVQNNGVRNNGGATTTTNKLHFSFDVPTTGVYTVVGEVHAPSGSDNSFWVQMDGSPVDGFYWSTLTSSALIEESINESGGPSQYPFDLSAGSHTLTLSMREDGTGIVAIRVVAMGSSNSAPVLTNPGTQNGTAGVPVDLQVVASDPEGDILSFSALGLPTGLRIDQRTGRITGTPTLGGTWTPTIVAFDGALVASATPTWTVAHANRPPVFATTPSQIAGQGVTGNLQISATDPDGDPRTFSATGLPAGLAIDPATGVISGIPSTLGHNALATVSVTDNVNPPASVGVWFEVVTSPFQCVVDGPSRTVTWTNQQANNYSVRHILDGTETYVGSTAALTYAITDLDGTYKIRYQNGGPIDTTCDGPGDPVFACTVNAGSPSTVTWTDQGASIYYVRHILNGTETYLGSSSGLSYDINDLDGTYKIRFGQNGVTFDTTCDGPGDPVFACTVNAGDPSTVTWTDQGASIYYVRHIKNGNNVYLGSSNGLSYDIADLDGTYLIRFGQGGVTYDTTCDGPGNPLFECADDGAGNLSWTDMSQLTYFVRQIIPAGGTSFIASTDQTSYTVSDPAPEYLIRYRVNGVTFDATCQKPA